MASVGGKIPFAPTSYHKYIIQLQVQTVRCNYLGIDKKRRKGYYTSKLDITNKNEDKITKVKKGNTYECSYSRRP